MTWEWEREIIHVISGKRWKTSDSACEGDLLFSLWESDWWWGLRPLNVDNHVVGRAPSIISICPCWHTVVCLALQGTSDKINSLCLRNEKIINLCRWWTFVFMFFRFTCVKRTLWSSNRLWLFNAFFSATAADSILAKTNNDEEKSGDTKITFGLCFWPIFSWCE